MPTYEYVCEECGREFEVNQSIKADPLERCTFDNCDGAVRRRMGTGAGIIFKGSGFYETDYKKNGGSKPKPESCPNTGSSESCSSCPAAAE